MGPKQSLGIWVFLCVAKTAFPFNELASELASHLASQPPSQVHSTRSFPSRNFASLGSHLPQTQPFLPRKFFLWVVPKIQNYRSSQTSCFCLISLFQRKKKSRINPTKGRGSPESHAKPLLESSAQIQFFGHPAPQAPSPHPSLFKNNPLTKILNPTRCCQSKFFLWVMLKIQSNRSSISKIKPCVSQLKSLYGETANGSLKQL